VYVLAQDILGNNFTTGAYFSVYGGPFKYNDTFIDYAKSSSNFNASGYAQLVVVESQTPGSYYNFSISYPMGTTTRQIDFDPVIIPNVGAVNLCTIATVKGIS
jgi:hypothetical protein